MSHIRVSHGGKRCTFVCVCTYTHTHACVYCGVARRMCRDVCVLYYVFMCIHTYICVKQTNIEVGL